MNNKERKTVRFALCYLLANGDDENVIEHFEESTGTEQPMEHSEYIENILNKITID